MSKKACEAGRHRPCKNPAAIHAAVIGGHNDLVMSLLDRGASPSVVNEVVRFLCAMTAWLLSAGRFGLRCSGGSCFERSPESYRYAALDCGLLRIQYMCVFVHVWMCQCVSVFKMVCMCECTQMCVRLFQMKLTPLCFAAILGNTPLVRALIARGSDPHWIDKVSARTLPHDSPTHVHNVC